MNDLNQIFQENLNGIAQNLISTYKIEFKKQVDGLSCPLMRWLDFRLRYIDPTPRRIVLSDAFPKKLPKTVEAGFLQIQNLMLKGEDINPYQSKAILRFHDISGKRKAKRTDLLWADWNIFHLHITDIPLKPGEFFSERKCSDRESWLLFFLVDASTFALIDIREHNEEGIFSDHEFISIMERSWPKYMDQFLIPRTIETPKSFSSQDLSSLRVAGINVPIILNGRAYFGPGMGITSAATSTRAGETAKKIRNWIRHISAIAANSDGQIQKHIRDCHIDQPSLCLCITSKGMAILEEGSNVAFTLMNDGNTEEHSTKMHHLFLPSWASIRLRSAM